MTAELPLLTDGEVHAKDFVEKLEKAIELYWVNQDKKEQEHLKQREVVIGKTINRLRAIEHGDWFLNECGEKEFVKCCHCRSCSQGRQNLADELLVDYNRLLWILLPDYRKNRWVETRWEGRSWDIVLVDVRNKNNKKVEVIE